MNQQRQLMRRLFNGTVTALLGALTGCGTNSLTTAHHSGKTVIKPAAVASEFESATRKKPEPAAGWVLVAEDPPTFFPAGLSPESNTDYRHGEWVAAGEREARWFVPRGGFGGQSEAALREQALASTTQAEKVKLALEAGGDFVGKSMWTSLLLAAATGAAMGGCQPDGLGDALETIWAH